MRAKILKNSIDELREAAEALKRGELVAFPTETVYGLGANALDAKAVLSIFKAKNRPCDNPLIVHIADIAEAEKLCYWNEKAQRLAEKFWPGPLTLLLPKRDIVPDITTAGLKSVAIRMPRHELALRLIELSKLPLAAPSANKSGRPSPTSAGHVFEDMKDDIPYIIDGGSADFGLESTVLSLVSDRPTIFRPGAVSREEIAGLIGDCVLADSLMRKLKEGESAPSPGMKHRHYAPRASLTLVKGKNTQEYIKNAYDGADNACILCFESNIKGYGDRKCYSLGENARTAARLLFELLRRADDEGIDCLFSETLEETGLGLAVMNRMLRASSFTLIDSDNL